MRRRKRGTKRRRLNYKKMLIVLIILVLAILAVVTGITSAVKFVSKKNKEKVQEEEKPKDIIMKLKNMILHQYLLIFQNI